jgi:hypothetical protein
MVNLSRLWAANANKTDWNAYAAAHPTVDGMGNSVRATGANWFCALGLRLLLIAQSVAATPPTIAAPEAPSGLALTPTANQISVAWTNPDLATTSVELWLDGPHTAGRAGSLAKARCIIRPLSDTSPGVIDTLQPGTYTLFARSLHRSNGLVSTYVSADCVVPAA